MAEQALPAQIGRYQVIRLIGEGGMGRVFAARDPQLDRVVALKQMAPGAEGGAQTLLAEALAMARLAHPNVVAVHDAGLEGGQAFVAMELVEGVTLREWQSAPERPWREILRAYIEAGRGLAAAHRAGITHRDFKPDNVLVSPDGRVRVTDFGLARSTTPAPGTDGSAGTRTVHPAPIPGMDDSAGAWTVHPAHGSPVPGTDGSAGVRTVHSTPEPSAPGTDGSAGARGAQPSVLMGTPKYMAPEQLTGARADPRSDQYAFCVSLSEALFDITPRPSTAYAHADSPRTVPLETARPERQPPPSPTSSRVPGRRAAPIRAALERGLSAAAEERHPSMESLLLALEQAAAPSRAWVPGAAAAALLAAVAVPLIVSRARVCADETSAVSDVWSPEARAAVEKSLSGPSREPARTHVVRALDAQARAWTQMASEACEATRVRHQQSAEALDLRMACLHQRLGELGAVSQALAAGVKGDAEAIDLSESLGPLAPCADPRTLAVLVPPPTNPDAVAELGRIRRELARIQAEEHGGKYADAVAHGEALAAAAAKAGYRPLEAEVQLQLGLSRKRLGNYTAAERAFQDALVAAEAGRHLRIKAVALTELVNMVGLVRDPQRARDWDRQAAAVIEALGGDRFLTAKRLIADSNMDLVEAKQEAAEEDARQAVALMEAELGPESMEAQRAVRALAQVLTRRGLPLKAVALIRQQMELRGRIFGPDNPERWTPINQLMTALNSAGYFTEALEEGRAAKAALQGKLAPGSNMAMYLDARTATALISLGRLKEALEISEELVQRAKGGTGRPRDMITALGLRGAALGMLGHFDEAIADQQAQQALLEKMGGGDSGSDRAAIAATESNIGLELIWAGKTDEGLRRVRAALETRQAIFPPKHPDLRAVYLDLAEGEILGGHPDRGLEPAKTALELGQSAAGQDSPTTALSQLLFAEALLGADKPAEAEPRARRALELWAAHPGLPDHAARAHFVLARSLASSSPAEALQEAEKARQGYAALESFRKGNAADVESWMARLRASPRIRGPESR